MCSLWRAILFLFIVRSSHTQEPELPDCPTSVQFFPQALPMHCKLPKNYTSFPYPTYASKNCSNSNNTNSTDASGSYPMGYPPQMPFMSPIASPKLPVIVMPFYTPHRKEETKKKPKDKERKRGCEYYGNCDKERDTDKDDTDESCSDLTSDSDDSSSSSSSSGYSSGGSLRARQVDGWWRPGKYHKNSKGWKGRMKTRRSGRRSGKPHRLKHKNYLGRLTPIIQYVTDDGYVIFEKNISDDEADDWLEMTKSSQEEKLKTQVKAKMNILEKEMDNLVKEVNLDEIETEANKDTTTTTTTTQKPVRKSRMHRLLTRRKEPKKIKDCQNC